jgi:hypothetical protein
MASNYIKERHQVNKFKSWDEYEIKARYIPTFLSVIPVAHFLILFVGMSFWQELIGNISWMLVITNLSLSLIVMLAIAQLQSALGKIWIEKSIFGKGGDRFPTTNMLLYNEGLISKDRKDLLRKKISEISDYTFSSEKEEKDDPENAKLQAREAVGYVRSKLGHGVKTIQYNIRYGFFRNLIAGAAWSCIGSLSCSILYYSHSEWKTMSLFLIYFAAFSALYTFRKTILERLAYDYADNLFDEFLSQYQGEK